MFSCNRSILLFLRMYAPCRAAREPLNTLYLYDQKTHFMWVPQGLCPVFSAATGPPASLGVRSKSALAVNRPARALVRQVHADVRVSRRAAANRTSPAGPARWIIAWALAVVLMAAGAVPAQQPAQRTTLAVSGADTAASAPAAVPAESPVPPASAAPPQVSSAGQRIYENTRLLVLQVRTLLKTQDSQAAVGSGFLVGERAAADRLPCRQPVRAPAGPFQAGLRRHRRARGRAGTAGH